MEGYFWEAQSTLSSEPVDSSPIYYEPLVFQSFDCWDHLCCSDWHWKVIGRGEGYWRNPRQWKVADRGMGSRDAIGLGFGILISIVTFWQSDWSLHCIQSPESGYYWFGGRNGLLWNHPRAQVQQVAVLQNSDGSCTKADCDFVKRNEVHLELYHEADSEIRWKLVEEI